MGRSGAVPPLSRGVSSTRRKGRAGPSRGPGLHSPTTCRPDPRSPQIPSHLQGTASSAGGAGLSWLRGDGEGPLSGTLGLSPLPQASLNSLELEPLVSPCAPLTPIL